LCYSSHLILFSWSGDLRDLHSFPTRRSSDLLTLGGHTGLLSLADLGTETSKSEVGVDLTVEGTAYLGSRSPFPEGSPWGALTVLPGLKFGDPDGVQFGLLLGPTWFFGQASDVR